MKIRPADLLACTLLVACVFVAHFWKLQEFGLYEDDYFFAASGGEYRWDQVPAVVRGIFANWTQGRPIGFALAFVLSWFGTHAGGLPSLYLMGYAIVACNTLLLYALVRRQFGATSSLYTGLLFALFPADTTRELLTHGLALQPALTCLLAACLLYQRGGRGWSVALAVPALLIYETPYLPFLAAPLLRCDRRPTLKDWGVHVFAFATPLALAGLVRRFFMESRMGAALDAPLRVLQMSLSSMVIGPFVALSACVSRLLTALKALEGWWILLVLAGAAALGWCLWSLSRRELPTPPRRYVQQALLGLGMLVPSYALTITADHYPPVTLEGRMTSVHLAAAVGVAVLGGALLAVCSAWLGRAPIYPLFCFGSGLYFTLLLCFGLYVQGHYVQAWKNQRAFWTQVVRLAPDLEPGTVVIVENVDNRGLSQGSFIYSHAWHSPLVLQLLYFFPGTRREGFHDFSVFLPEGGPPCVYTVGQQWEQKIIQREGALLYMDPGMFKPFFRSDRALPLPEGNVILLQARQDRLSRVQGMLSANGISLRLKPSGPPTPLRRKPLYGELVGDAAVVR